MRWALESEPRDGLPDPSLPFTSGAYPDLRSPARASVVSVVSVVFLVSVTYVSVVSMVSVVSVIYDVRRAVWDV